MTDKPPWIARNRRERQAMVDWVNARLDEPHASAHDWTRKEGREYQWVEKGNGVLVQTSIPDDGTFEALKALEGDIEPARALIRKCYPLLVDVGLVQLPPLRPGKKYRRGYFITSKNQVDHAVTDVPRIRRIWAAPEPHGYGKTNRAQDQVSAIEIAAKRHGVDMEELSERVKRASRTK
jgi:hypothetical protein